MAVYLNLDEDGYLYGICRGPEPGENAALPYVDSVDGLNLSGVRMLAYRWDGEKLVLDEARLAELEERERQAESTEQIDAIKAKLAATDYAVIKIAEGAATREEYASVIAQRQEWREEINRLEAADV